MKVLGLVLPIVLLVLAVAALRYQYNSVVDRVANPGESSFPSISGTPIGSQLCGANGKKCDLPGLISGTPARKPCIAVYIP